MKTISLTLLATAAMPFATMAQDAPASEAAQEDIETEAEVEADIGIDQVEGSNDDFHNVIYVSAAGVDRLDLVAGTSVVTGIALQRESSGQVGDILASLPGVESSGFAPGASRPVLRGFSGDRVRVLNDGIGTLDASGVSDDHAVAADPLIAERIEVLRGPAVLLYGSQAIGGAVNVVTKRIPPRMLDEPIHIDALASFDSVSDLLEGGLSVDVPLGSNVAFHVDGSYRNTDDIDIPGFVASDSLRSQLLTNAAAAEDAGELDEADELRETANLSGVLPNSFSETYSAGVGIAAFVGENNFGISFDYYDTNYGVPESPLFEEEGGDGAEGEEEEGGVSIGLRRYRFDARASFDLGDGFFETVQARGGLSDYTHTEFEGAEVGTLFTIGGVEGRVELIQAPRGGWTGSIGAQYSAVDFDAIGEEAFVPKNITDTFALFTLQEVGLSQFELEGGARFETTSIDATRIGEDRSFDTFSASLGAGYYLAEELRIGANFSRTERAPSATELFADGPHIATQQFELGNAALDVESNYGVEGYVRGEVGALQINASVYRNYFSDFIYLAATGEIEDGLPVFAFLQQDADHWGAEGQVTFPVVEGRNFSLLGDLRGSYTRAELDDGDNVPRIPALSLYGAMEARWEHFDLRGEVEWFDDQRNLAALETPTDGFTHVNVSLAWHPFEGDENLTLLAKVDNIFDTDGRRATSFTKDFVPLPGRNFSISARASF